METIAELREVMETFPVEDEEILQMQVNRVKKLGSYHLPQKKVSRFLAGIPSTCLWNMGSI